MVDRFFDLDRGVAARARLDCGAGYLGGAPPGPSDLARIPSNPIGGFKDPTVTASTTIRRLRLPAGRILTLASSVTLSIATDDFTALEGDGTVIGAGNITITADLVVLDAAKTDSAKTGELVRKLGALGWSSALVIGGAVLDESFRRAASNIPGVDVLPEQGVNVYDILRRDTLVLTKDAVEALEARLK